MGAVSGTSGPAGPEGDGCDDARARKVTHSAGHRVVWLPDPGGARGERRRESWVEGDLVRVASASLL